MSKDVEVIPPAVAPRNNNTDDDAASSTAVTWRTVCIALQVTILFAVFTALDPLGVRRYARSSSSSEAGADPLDTPGAEGIALEVHVQGFESSSSASSTGSSTDSPQSVASPSPPPRSEGEESVAETRKVPAQPDSPSSPLPTPAPFDPDAPLDVHYAPAITTERTERHGEWVAWLWQRLHEQSTAKATASSSPDPTASSSVTPQPRPTFPRVLETERFAGKYGLTNVLITAASMMMYAAMDERAVHFPTSSPVHMERLLDLNATEELLRPLNIVLFSDAEFKLAYPGAKAMRARKLMFNLGNRLAAGSEVRQIAETIVTHQRVVMRKTASHAVLAQRDFFLTFPSRATAPLDICFFLKRMVYQKEIRSMASQLLHRLRARGVQRYVTLHLRLEADAILVQKEATAVTADNLRTFLKTQVMPIVLAANADALYVCSGKLKPEYMAVLKNESYVKPIYFKTDFEDVTVPMVDERTVVTSHEGAAVDALLMKHAASAIALHASTFGVGVMAARCPSPYRGSGGSPADDLRQAVKQFSWMGTGVSKLVKPDPGSVALAAETASALGLRVPKVAHENMYFYQFFEDGRFSDVRYVSCEEQQRWCYYRN